MTAINTMGAPARNPSATLPSIPSPTAHLVYESTVNGLLVTRNHTPLAWIHSGNHRNACGCARQFFDVAYHRHDMHGSTLETAFFDTLQEAVDFVSITFAGGAA